MFEKVCGLALKNTVIMTTHWDVVGNERAVESQQVLVTGQQYFKPLCDAGASTFGHDNTHASAQQVMNKLLSNNPIVLQMQEELKAGMTLEQTAAGSQLSAHLDALRKKHEAEMKKLREEMEDAMRAKDDAWKKELNDELAKLREDRAKLMEDMEQLKNRPYVLLFRLVHDLTKMVLSQFGWWVVCGNVVVYSWLTQSVLIVIVPT
jgi:hypothetical protein